MRGTAARKSPARPPAYQDGEVTVHMGDAREVMQQMPSESIDCVVTSPPYWALRDFGVAPTVWGGDPSCDHRWVLRTPGRRRSTSSRSARGRFCAGCDAWLGSLGLEPTPDLFVAHMVDFFRGVRRLLKPTGTLWLNLGDNFYGSALNAGPGAGLKPKDLVGIPWRVALALQADGWYLRSDIIWHKPNPVPEPAPDRPVRAHELLFLLSREPHYFYDAQAVREPSAGSPGLDRGLRSVWTIPTQAFRGSHTATFPTRLVEPCILAGTSQRGCCAGCGRPWRRELEVTYEPRGSGRRGAGRKADPRVFEFSSRQVRHARTVGWRPSCECRAPVTPAVVLDPFAGTGTTLAVAAAVGRRAVGIELNPAYLPLIRRRCGGAVAGGVADVSEAA